MNNSENLSMLHMMTSGLKGLDVDVKEVEVKHKPHSRSEKKQCFNNSFRFLSAHYDPDSRYVLGYLFLHGKLPVEHAWVKIGDQNFDVTLDPQPDDIYYSVVEVDDELLNQYVADEGHAPDLNALNRWVRLNKKEPQ